MFGRIIIFDGRNGTVLRWMQTPDRRESYYPPQILTWLDGEQFVLFGTGGNSRSVSRQSYGSYSKVLAAMQEDIKRAQSNHNVRLQHLSGIKTVSCSVEA